MKFIKCKMCGVKLIDGEKCELASYRRNIDAKQHVFCCPHCVDEFEKKQKQIKKAKA